MESDFLNIGLAFLEGLALVASPCILPILPIILSASVGGSKKRPFGIIIGFVLSFALFTYFSRQLVLLFGLDLNLVRDISFALLIILGVVMISSYLTDKFNEFTQVFANIGFKATKNDSQTGFASGLLFGGLIGLIWTPCAGPILAAVIVQTIIQHTSISSFLTILAFALGAAIPMLIIMLFGQQLTAKVKFLEHKAVLLRKILGGIIILAVLYMLYGTALFTSAVHTKLNSSHSGKELEEGITPYRAPDPTGITSWVNSEPLTMEHLKGKVVLVDFWAYSCINCARTIPYLVDWYQKYHEQGLEIIGIHAPEFDFEKELANVKKAVQQYNITYPVALDNHLETWREYKNNYWPAHYLINKKGEVVYTHFGEGKYDVTENNIRYLLGIHEQKVKATQAVDKNIFETPETYLGYARGTQFSSSEIFIKDERESYTYLDTQLDADAWALQGPWLVNSDKITSEHKDVAIKIHFNAKKVFAVMGSKANHPVKIKLLLNDQAVTNGEIEVTGHDLYTLLDLPELTDGYLELLVSEPGLEMYTFTFGG